MLTLFTSHLVRHKHQQFDMLRCLLKQKFFSKAVATNSTFCARRDVRQICQKSKDHVDVSAILSFFQLQGRQTIWRKLLDDSSHTKYLATIGDACLRHFVVKELALRGMQTSGQLSCSSQRYLTNSQLALLGSKLHLSAALSCAGHEPPSKRTMATTVEALIGAGEMHLSGLNTQGVVLIIMHFIDNGGETSAVKCCHHYPHASTLMKWLGPLQVNSPLLPILESCF